MTQPDEASPPAPAYNATEETREEQSSESEKDGGIIHEEDGEDVKEMEADIEKGSIKSGIQKAEVKNTSSSAV